MMCVFLVILWMCVVILMLFRLGRLMLSMMMLGGCWCI